MNRIWAYYRQHERAFNLGLALFGFLFSLWVYFVPFTPTPELTFYVQQKSHVFKINKPVDNLKVLYYDQDIRQKKQNLIVYTVRVINEGGVDIEEGSYSSRDSFGLIIKNSRVLSANLVPEADEYFKRNVHFNVKDSSRVFISKEILEADKYFDFELLMITKEGQLPDISAMGKVVGQKEIVVDPEEYNKSGEDRKKRMNNVTAYYVDNWDQFLFAILIFLFIFTGLSIKKRLHKNRLLKLYNRQYPELIAERKCLFDIYKNLKRKEFIQILDLLSNSQKLNEFYSQSKAEIKLLEQVNKLVGDKKTSGSNKKELEYKSIEFNAIERLIEDDFANVNENYVVNITEQMLEEISKTKELLQPVGN